VYEGLLANLYNAYYVDDNFILLSSQGILTSTDGWQWNLLNNITITELNYDDESEMYYGANDYFLYIGASLQTLAPYSFPASIIGSYVIGNDVVVAEGGYSADFESEYYIYSTPLSDLSAWATVFTYSRLDEENAQLGTNVVYAQGMFWFVDMVASTVRTSTDGTTWNSASSSDQPPSYCPIIGQSFLQTANDLLYTNCENTDSGMAVYVDGEWQNVTAPYNTIEIIEYLEDAELYYSVASQGPATITSVDGITWAVDNDIYSSAVVIDPLEVFAITTGDGVWIATAGYYGFPDTNNIIYRAEASN